jgi:quercetin dioxygenase-like cupin family protein
MIEKEYFYTISDEKIIEKLIEDDHVGINHIILPKDQSIPEHYSNSNVYLVIIRGILSLQLGEEKENEYSEGSILAIPYQTKMNGRNHYEESVEFFVVKAPSPKMMKKP